MGLWKRSWPIIYWLPTGEDLQFFYSLADSFNPGVLASQLSILIPLQGEISQYLIVLRSIRWDYAIVTISLPFENPDRILIKRVLALEGDVVKTLPPYPDHEIVVPEGHVWVEGDEPFFSDDSNRFGPIPRALLDSKLVMIIWPLNRFGSIKRPEFPPNNYGLANRLATIQLEREKARRVRVTIQS